jgi:hypothetical protein
MHPGHALLAVSVAEPEALLALLDGRAGLGPELREPLRARLAARVLAGDHALLEQLPADEPVRRHGPAALEALRAYCEGDDQALGQALAAIPFRSPYRDWVQIHKALVRHAEAPGEARASLERIAEDSPFASLKRAALLSLLPDSAFLEALAAAGASERRVACALRGWPPERLGLWQELARLGPEPPPKALIRTIHLRRQALGAEWARHKCLVLAAAGGPSLGSQWLREAGAAPPSTIERARMDGWASDPRIDPWAAVDNWAFYAELLQGKPGQTLDADQRLRIALVLRRADAEGDLLGGHEVPDDVDHCGNLAAAQLEESLRWDPDDLGTYLRLIAFYRRAHRPKDARPDRLLSARPSPQGRPAHPGAGPGALARGHGPTHRGHGPGPGFASLQEGQRHRSAYPRHRPHQQRCAPAPRGGAPIPCSQAGLPGSRRSRPQGAGPGPRVGP